MCVTNGARTVLVAHSGAAVPVTVAVDRHVDEVDHVVWVDTVPVVDGYAIDPNVEGSEHPLSAQYDEELEQGSMEGLSEEQLATFRARAVPQPTASMREPAALHDARRLDVPGTIVCTSFPAAAYRSSAEQGLPFLAGLLVHAQRLPAVRSGLTKSPHPQMNRAQVLQCPSLVAPLPGLPADGQRLLKIAHGLNIPVLLRV